MHWAVLGLRETDSLPNFLSFLYPCYVIVFSFSVFSLSLPTLFLSFPPSVLILLGLVCMFLYFSYSPFVLALFPFALLFSCAFRLSFRSFRLSPPLCPRFYSVFLSIDTAFLSSPIYGSIICGPSLIIFALSSYLGVSQCAFGNESSRNPRHTVKDERRPLVSLSSCAIQRRLHKQPLSPY